MNTALSNRKEFVSQAIFFHVVFMTNELLIWSYYSILLLRASNNSIPTVFLNQGIFLGGLMLGYMISGVSLLRIGYRNAFRLSNLMQLIAVIVTILTLPQILQVHLAIALLRGASAGFFWSTENTFNMREVTGIDRTRLIGLRYSLDLILAIIIPITAGAMIGGYGYEIGFLISASIYFLGLVYPWKYNMVPRDELSFKEFKQLTKARGFGKWAIIIYGEELIMNQRNIVMGVLPFLLIGNEFGVGLLTSVVGVIAAALAFIHRADNIRKLLPHGYLGAGIVTITTSILVFVWTLPALIFRQLVSTLGFAMYEPVITDIRYHNKESLLGDFKQQYALEIEQYGEFLLFLARMTNFFVISVLLFGLAIDPYLLMKILLFVTLVREYLFLFLHVSLSKFLRR